MARRLPLPRSILYVLVLFAVLILTSALILEGTIRLRHRMKYGTGSVSMVEYGVDKISGLRTPVPGSDTGRIKINSLGFRGPELSTPKPASRIRLAFLGASTTFCAEASSDEASWPHLVWKKFKTVYPAADFDYLNAGVPGFKTSESLINLARRVNPHKPDLIVIYHATNDLSYDTRKLAARQGIYQSRPDELSWLAGVSLAWFLVEKNFQIRMRQRDALSGSRHLSFDAKEVSVDFHDRLTRLVLASQETAPVVAVVTFSYKFRREQPQEEQLKAANTALYYMPYMTVNGLLDAFEEYNRVIRDVARQTGAVLIEDEFSIPGDDRHFNDSVHFKDAGSELMAQRVASALIASGKIDRLLAIKKKNLS